MFMHRIKLENILSFGPDAQELELKPLNVLIGPNGSGKSNLIEVIGLLRAATNNIMAPIREGGGFNNWIWNGDLKMKESRVEVIVGDFFSSIIPSPNEDLFRYSIAFDPLFPFREKISRVRSRKESSYSSEHYLERRGEKIILTYRDESGKIRQRERSITDFRVDQTILSQIKEPFQYPELAVIENGLSEINIYRDWFFGRNTPLRLLQKADLPNNSLSEDGRNLGMVLNRIERNSGSKRKFLSALQKLYGSIDDYYVQIEAGSVQVFLKEGNYTVPAVRLSDGTLRYLCLLAILCNPSLPKMICIEEPELGLHPDILPGLADLLRDASERCQIIVTTHSDVLVDALTDTPESIVICEKEDGQTKLKRLNADELSPWLEKYKLGELWTSGELGGARW